MNYSPQPHPRDTIRFKTNQSQNAITRLCPIGCLLRLSCSAYTLSTNLYITLVEMQCLHNSMTHMSGGDCSSNLMPYSCLTQTRGYLPILSNHISVVYWHAMTTQIANVQLRVSLYARFRSITRAATICIFWLRLWKLWSPIRKSRASLNPLPHLSALISHSGHCTLPSSSTSRRWKVDGRLAGGAN